VAVGSASVQECAAETFWKWRLGPFSAAYVFFLAVRGLILARAVKLANRRQDLALPNSTN